jgi:type I restriction enzyme M protein
MKQRSLYSADFWSIGKIILRPFPRFGDPWPIYTGVFPPILFLFFANSSPGRTLRAFKPLSWAEIFATETAKGIPVLRKNHKSFIKALMNAFGKRDPEMDPVVDAEGKIVPDPDFTDYENIPLPEDIRDYFAREVLPYVPDAYIDETFRDDKDNQIGRVEYEINFNRYCYQYKPPRLLEAIDADLQQIEAEIAALLREVTE